MRKLLVIIAGLFFGVISMQAQSNQWTWIKGDSAIFSGTTGVYGTLGVGSVSNRPGSRKGAATWTDASGNFWMFGGSGYGESQSIGSLNDLWKYNPVTNQWTWVRGTKLTDQKGIYGTLGTAAAGNNPGGRFQAVTWIDAAGILWLFGGLGSDEASVSSGRLNDLWKYNPATNQWTWVNGDKLISKFGVYGTQGTGAAANKPGSRYKAMSWTDASGNFWLMGGDGFGESGSAGNLNDLWRYVPGTNIWTWMKGDKLRNFNGVYGTQGIASSVNKPGTRNSATTWKDATGNFWLMGGFGMPEAGSNAMLNDIWKYSTATNNWTWVNGDKTSNNAGVYGTKGVAAATNKPGSRAGSMGWIDAGNNLWLMGGVGYNESVVNTGRLCDIWKYNSTTNQWMWVNGSKAIDTVSNYGAQGLEAPGNSPGSRETAQTWKDASGNFYMLGGLGSDNMVTGVLNDCWKFNPVTGNWTWVRDYFIIGYKGIYGTKGVPASNNRPGSRSSAATWTDISGNLWLFGGDGNGGQFQRGGLNDLWKYNITTNQWAWMNGDTTCENYTIYGTKGVSSPANKPGARREAVTWVDGNGKFWLFGGYGFDGFFNTEGALSDLWKYDPLTNEWTWIHGSDQIDVPGFYGTRGVPDPINKPGGRYGAVSWTDPAGFLWLFGGFGWGNGSQGMMNDVWKYNIATNQWTWMKGSGITDVGGNYGILGVSDIGNNPGSRQSATAFRDTDNNLWLFGGYGIDNSFSFGELNDLWKFNPGSAEWTWMSGDNSPFNTGVYGTLGVPSATNKPGARSYANGWQDIEGNFWLFGGSGYSVNSSPGFLNDLWKFNPVTNNWAWVRGDNVSDNPGIYGTFGVPAATNKPGARMQSFNWTGIDGKLWLMGGYGIGTSITINDFMNDLWSYIPCTGSINLTPASTMLCQGATVHLVASGGTGTFQWYKDDVLIPGVSINNYDATSTGTYYVTSTDGSCVTYSNAALVIQGAVSPSLGGTGVYCLGDPVNVGIPVTQPDQDYTWLRNNNSVYGPIGGNGGNQSLQFNMDAGRAGTYIVRSSKSGCPNVLSNNVYVGFAQINHLTVYALCNNSVSFIWDQVVPGFVSQKYQYAVTTSPVPPVSGTVSTANFQSVSALNPSTTYYIHVRSACGFDLSTYGDWSTISVVTEATPLPAGVAEWTGAYNSDWFNTSNWKCGFIPITISAVIIPGGRPNYPSLGSDFIVKSLDMKPGALMYVNDGIKLTITSQ